MEKAAESTMEETGPGHPRDRTGPGQYQNSATVNSATHMPGMIQFR